MGLYIVICCWMLFLAFLGYDKEIAGDHPAKVQNNSWNAYRARVSDPECNDRVDQ